MPDNHKQNFKRVLAPSRTWNGRCNGRNSGTCYGVPDWTAGA